MHFREIWEGDEEMRRKVHVLVLMVSPAVRMGGGIIQNILNYKDQIIQDNMELYFAINIEDDDVLIQKLTEYGEKWLRIPNKKKNYLQYIRAIKELCQSGEYDVIHIHGNSATMLPELWLAKHYGIKKRIAHCHNSRCSHPILNAMLKPYFNTLYTDALACSDLAGEWLFGKERYTVLRNAINLDRYLFSENFRQECRAELEISENTVLIGHIGLFNEQKNHDFLIDLFYDLQQQENAELILFGQGELISDIANKCKRLGIEEKVHFMGVRSEIEKWLSAMDIFIFPSKWEGLGMVAIEAQVSGLSVLASDAVPQEVRLTDRIQFLSLEEDRSVWLEELIKMLKNQKERKMESSIFNNYDIQKEKNKLIKLYDIR